MDCDGKCDKILCKLIRRISEVKQTAKYIMQQWTVVASDSQSDFANAKSRYICEASTKAKSIRKWGDGEAEIAKFQLRWAENYWRNLLSSTEGSQKQTRVAMKRCKQEYWGNFFIIIVMVLFRASVASSRGKFVPLCWKLDPFVTIMSLWTWSV